jgi:hypothetical protein
LALLNDPTLYVEESWTGTCDDILAVEEVSVLGRIWCVSLLFSEFYHKKFILDCIEESASFHRINSDRLFAVILPQLREVIAGTRQSRPTIESVLSYLRGFWGDNTFGDDSSMKKFRLAWALRWVCEGNVVSYPLECKKSIRDISISYDDRSDSDAMMLAKLDPILDNHP